MFCGGDLAFDRNAVAKCMVVLSYCRIACRAVCEAQLSSLLALQASKDGCRFKSRNFRLFNNGFQGYRHPARRTFCNIGIATSPSKQRASNQRSPITYRQSALVPKALADLSVRLSLEPMQPVQISPSKKSENPSGVMTIKRPFITSSTQTPSATDRIGRLHA